MTGDPMQGLPERIELIGSVMSPDEIREAKAKVSRILSQASEPSDPESDERDEAAWNAATQAAEIAKKALDSCEAVRRRAMMAELVIYRATILARDLESLVKKGEEIPRKMPKQSQMAGIVRRYVQDYVDEILPIVREVVGYEPGDEARGRYLEAEASRSKMIGLKRAKARLAGEPLRRG